MATLIRKINYTRQPQFRVRLRTQYSKYFSGSAGYVYTPQLGLTQFIDRRGWLLAGTYRLTKGYDDHGKSVRTNTPSNDQWSFDNIIPPIMLAGTPEGYQTYVEGFTWIMVEAPQEVYIPDNRLASNQWVNGHDFGGPAIIAGIAFKSTGYYFENICYGQGDIAQTGRAVYSIQRNPQQLYTVAATHKAGASGYNRAFCNGVKLTPYLDIVSLGSLGRGRVEGILPPAMSYERHPKLYMMAVSNRVVPDNILMELSRNPWSLFEPHKGDIYNIGFGTRRFRRNMQYGTSAGMRLLQM